jgi:Protein of unknown function (DUF2877)
MRATWRGWQLPTELCCGTVRLVTARAIYLAVSAQCHGQLVVSVQPDSQAAPRSPLSISLDSDDWLLLCQAISVADDVRLADGRLLIGGGGESREGVCLVLQGATVWSPTDVHPVIASNWELMQLLLRAHIEDENRGCGLQLRSASLKRALIKGEDRAPAVLGLLGCGPGLTPSGDDILCGLLVGLRHWSRDQRWFAQLSASVSDVLDDFPDSTTLVSTQMLRHAVKGWGHEFLIDLCAAAGCDSEFERAAKRLISLGATSGADTLMGLAGALDLMQQSMPDGAMVGA